MSNNIIMTVRPKPRIITQEQADREWAERRAREKAAGCRFFHKWSKWRDDSRCCSRCGTVENRYISHI
jgi:hypothetical protein